MDILPKGNVPGVMKSTIMEVLMSTPDERSEKSIKVFIVKGEVGRVLLGFVMPLILNITLSELGKSVDKIDSSMIVLSVGSELHVGLSPFKLLLTLV